MLQGSGTGIDLLGVTAAFIVVQLLLVALSGVRSVESAVLSRGALRVDVVAGVGDQRVQELYATLRALPSVRAVTYVPREQVLARERARDAALASFLEQYGIDNPFADTFEILPEDRGGYDAVRALVRDDRWTDVIDASSLAGISAQEAAVVELLEAIGIVRMGTVLLIILTAVVAGFLAFNLLVRLAALRRPDAQAELFAGASSGILAMPAIVAGMLGLLGALAVASFLAAFLTVVLALFPQSALVGAFLTQSFFATLLPLVPLALGAEVISLGVLAWIVGRAGVAFRS